MQFPESWLRKFIDPDLSTEELAHVLTMAGLEVDAIKTAAPAFEGVVVAKVVAVNPHPDADRLSVCEVNDGSGTNVQIVCGAPNVAPGITVPLAKIGAVLPGGLKIKKAKMRGVESFGMLCSGTELGLDQDVDGLMLLNDSLPAGDCLRGALNLDDIIFELSLTPNRADCLSILGVAREVAALTNASLNLPEYTPVNVDSSASLAVNVQATDLCGRFAGRVIEGVNAKAQTPGWMAEKLIRCGQRPVSVLVDISNYVMLMLGRPTHVFDLDKLGHSLDVHWGNNGDKLELLNGQTITLNNSTGVISSNGKPESLAGIMGGMASSVTLDTTNIYLEGAFWWPEAIMGKSRQYKLESEASHRFERGVDPHDIPGHLELTTRLILDICGGKAGPLDDQILNIPVHSPVAMRLDRCNKVLGITLSHDEVNKIFTSLGFEFSCDQNVFTVVPPSYRFDLQIEEDLIEEVARIYGYEQIPDNPPVAVANMLSKSESKRDGHDLRAAMAALDYQEVINFSFVDESWETNYSDNSNPIHLINPIASNLSVMRSSLIGGLLANIQYNAHHRQPRVRVFELGRIFKRDAQIINNGLNIKGISQPVMLAGAAWGSANPDQWGMPSSNVDFYDVKRDLEVVVGTQLPHMQFMADTHPALHPGRSARIVLNEKNVGWIGEVHPKWVTDLGLTSAPVVFEIDSTVLLKRDFPIVAPISRHPAVVRDLAVLVEKSVTYQELLNTIKKTIQAQPELGIINKVSLFDVWRNTSQDSTEKSMAFRFWLQHPSQTLDDATVEQCINSILNALSKAHEAKLRA